MQYAGGDHNVAMVVDGNSSTLVYIYIIICMYIIYYILIYGTRYMRSDSKKRH